MITNSLGDIQVESPWTSLGTLTRHTDKDRGTVRTATVFTEIVGGEFVLSPETLSVGRTTIPTCVEKDQVIHRRPRSKQRDWSDTRCSPFTRQKQIKREIRDRVTDHELTELLATYLNEFPSSLPTPCQCLPKSFCNSRSIWTFLIARYLSPLSYLVTSFRPLNRTLFLSHTEVKSVSFKDVPFPPSIRNNAVPPSPSQPEVGGPIP